MPVILQNLLLSLTLFIWDIGVRKISCGRIVSYGVIVINVFNECSRSRSDICNGRKNGSTVADVYTNCSLYNFYIVQLKQYSGHRFVLCSRCTLCYFGNISALVSQINVVSLIMRS